METVRRHAGDVPQKRVAAGWWMVDGGRVACMRFPCDCLVMGGFGGEGGMSLEHESSYYGGGTYSGMCECDGECEYEYECEYVWIDYGAMELRCPDVYSLPLTPYSMYSVLQALAYGGQVLERGVFGGRIDCTEQAWQHRGFQYIFRRWVLGCNAAVCDVCLVNMVSHIGLAWLM